MGRVSNDIGILGVDVVTNPPKVIDTYFRVSETHRLNVETKWKFNSDLYKHNELKFRY